MYNYCINNKTTIPLPPVKGIILTVLISSIKCHDSAVFQNGHYPLCLNKSREKIMISEQVVWILPSRPSDRLVANGAHRLLDFGGTSCAGCECLSVCALTNDETRRCWTERCPWLYCQGIDRLQVPVDTSIQPVAALLHTPQMQQVSYTQQREGIVTLNNRVVILSHWEVSHWKKIPIIMQGCFIGTFVLFYLMLLPLVLQIHLPLCREVFHWHWDLLQTWHRQPSRCLQHVCSREEAEDYWWDNLPWTLKMT